MFGIAHAILKLNRSWFLHYNCLGKSISKAVNIEVRRSQSPRDFVDGYSFDRSSVCVDTVPCSSERRPSRESIVYMTECWSMVSSGEVDFVSSSHFNIGLADIGFVDKTPKQIDILDFVASNLFDSP